MKKSILALSAAAALGGLGFAGAAHAVAYLGTGGTIPAAAPQADAVRLSAGNIGHFLYMPYYSVQGNMNTLLNITNTDMTNAKAVKVRFRGAANSDDVLDFTVFLSPGDVWTASLTQGADGRAQISTPDSSCTLPSKEFWPANFNPQRLASYLGDAAKDAHTREGYVEILNMADIPPSLTTGATFGNVKNGPTVGFTAAKQGSTNPVFTAVKHVNGVAPCTSSAFDGLLDTNVVTTGTDAEGYGLAAPTGGLMGSWAVLSQNQLAVYGGEQTAIQATQAAATPVGGDTDTPRPNATTTRSGNIAFAPQRAAATGLSAADTQKWTADPLIRNGNIAQALWFDYPDMSTPLALAPAADAPIKQANSLSSALSKPAIYNDYIATSAGAVVPMETDWVVSQPTRRYHAAVNYGTSSTTATIVWNPSMAAATLPGTPQVAVTNNRYAGLTLRSDLELGPYACMSFGFSAASREEKFTSAAADFSPGATSPYCGEVFTMSFNGTSKVLQAKVSNHGVTAPAEAGWARLDMGTATATTGGGAGNPLYLPVVGFAATSMKNTRADGSGGNYGMTINHRW